MARIYLGNVKGPQGETGATGATGPQGEAATIEVGSVSTTAYGNAAQVTNVGTENDAILNFVIPHGKPGEKTTTMGGLTLDTITTSTEEFPSPAVGDTGATAFGKIVKFFSDVLASLTNKIDVSKIANDFTTTDPSYVAAAPTVKALNDSLTNFMSIRIEDPQSQTEYTFDALHSFGVALVFTHYDVWVVYYDNSSASYSKLTSFKSTYNITSASFSNNKITITFDATAWAGIVVYQ